ncbi:MAG TPA: alpha/beta hydrolase [Actinomycetota bacterium]|nr:alpha/beta hydrolase [Actinomycetota bacterium]
MTQIATADADLHVELDGGGDPVTVLAHGLTNSCRELAVFTPMLPGTKVRFCFRGHGHSSTPESGYRFADFARDLDAVAAAFGATRAVGTSLGAGAICHLLARRPDRFERLVFLLPAALDLPFEHRESFLRTAELLERLPTAEAIDAILSEGGRLAKYEETPWLRDFDLALWEDMNPVGVARAIREVVDDVAVEDREALRAVEAPALIVCREGDLIHPAELGRVLARLMPNAELVVAGSEEDLIASIPTLVASVAEFLS